MVWQTLSNLAKQTIQSFLQLKCCLFDGLEDIAFVKLNSEHHEEFTILLQKCFLMVMVFLTPNV